jgi:hypothetical protein
MTEDHLHIKLTTRPACLHQRGGTLEPLYKWPGRYRCTSCGVFFHPDTRHGEQRDRLIPYRCHAKECKNGAITKLPVNKPARKPGKHPHYWWCSRHRPRRNDDG